MFVIEDRCIEPGRLRYNLNVNKKKEETKKQREGLKKQVVLCTHGGVLTSVGLQRKSAFEKLVGLHSPDRSIFPSAPSYLHRFLTTWCHLGINPFTNKHHWTVNAAPKISAVFLSPWLTFAICTIPHSFRLGRWPSMLWQTLTDQLFRVWVLFSIVDLVDNATIKIRKHGPSSKTVR